jgi:adenylosuccinate synthase
MEKVDIIVDLQYGSTGKGLIVGYLAENGPYDAIITAWAPNAGHTYIDKNGRTFIHTHLANGIVGPAVRKVFLGPGSLINPQQLLAEIEQCRDVIEAKGIQIHIHPHAAIVTDRHIEEEAGPMTKIGSTKKGVGAAMIQRIRRNPDDQNIAAACNNGLSRYVVTVEQYRQALKDSEYVMVEGAQGYGLSMYHGFYPYTTSRDVSIWQILADSGIQAADVLDKYRSHKIRAIGTCRTYPIRVANRFDTEGTQVGYSGPCYDDQIEIAFEDIGQKTELTTVTKLPRRIFTFSGKQIEEAIRHNGVYEVFLNFVNYVQTEVELIDIVQRIERKDTQVRWIGVGPAHKDVRQISGDRAERMKAIVQYWKECRNDTK